MNVALLVPTTSFNRNWKTIKESYLLNITIKSFLSTCDKNNNYKFFIGIDKDDRIFSDKDQQKIILSFINSIETVNIKLEFFIMENIDKGHLTKMWNLLFTKALNENYDYFFQCGDDIKFITEGWINECITTLQKSEGIGLVGPLNNNSRILTQSFVSRKHNDLFGYFFPPEIINWFCDDWINLIYQKINSFFPLYNHVCFNIGGPPRYNVNNNKDFNLNMKNNYYKLKNDCFNIVERDLEKIKIKLNSQNIII